MLLVRRIMLKLTLKPKHTITGIAGGKNFAALYLRKYMLNKGSVFTLKLMEIFNRHHVSYEHMPSGIDDLTVIFKKDALSDQLINVICNGNSNQFKS